MTNLNALTCDSMTIGSYALPIPDVQTLTGDGAITIKHGIVRLNKGSAINATLANPSAGTDDYKMLVIAAVTAQANTVTCTEGFGNPTADCIKEGEDVATFGGAIGDCLTVVAYNGAWYVKGLHGITIA
jgi:hypothetical protein